MTSRCIPAIFLWICVLFSFCMGKLHLLCYYIMTQAGLANDCCLSVGKKEIAFSFLTGYEIQDIAKGCAINAVVLITRKGLKLCVAATDEWVKKVVARIDKETERFLQSIRTYTLILDRQCGKFMQF
uniref:C-C motif chemokine n=1 Tax=Paramormyrops kingsleyae TaxID=1676925 RepID=A0A3B3T2A1_9TELE